MLKLYQIFMKQLVIIGGGITGTYAAYLAATHKFPVKVFEALPKVKWLHNVLSTRKCGEGVWYRKLQAAGIKFGLKNMPEWVENSTTNLLLGRHFKNDKIEFLKGKIEPYLFLNRQKFILDLQKKSVTLGAEWHFGKNVNNLGIFPKNSLVIGAWGTNPRLLSEATKKFKQDYLLACQHTLKNINSSKINNAKVVILSDNPAICYFYLFPKDNTKSAEANFGVVFNKLSIRNPSVQLNNLRNLNFQGILEKNKIIPNRSFVKVICAGPPIENDAVFTNLLLVGDAGSTTDSISTGGIGFGLLAAKLAIEASDYKDPQKAFQEKMRPLWEKLRKSYSLAKRHYPKNQIERKKFNDLYFAKAKEILKKGGYLSLSKIAQTIFLA